nr:UDP-N-acetylmuramate dehydrogenase [Caulobacter sp. 17J65-9]
MGLRPAGSTRTPGDRGVSWRDTLPETRGKLLKGAELAPFTWFRVGGPADVLFLPEDHEDLEAFLKGLDAEVPVTVLGVGSNTLVRDGGVDGVVIRLGKAFGRVETMDGNRIYGGAAVLDATLAKKAAEAGLAGLEFFRGVPGTIGGACVMNAGCYGAETKDVLVEAYAVDRAGERHVLSAEDMGFTYRRSEAAATRGLIFTGAVFQGVPDEPDAVMARMDEITARREATQPIKEKTGGSTFKNPQGHSSWKLVDDAGWRGKPFGGAQFSELHSNFMINTGEATAADLEGLGEAVRADVKDKFGVELEWEIKRIGRTK